MKMNKTREMRIDEFIDKYNQERDMEKCMELYFYFKDVPLSGILYENWKSEEKIYERLKVDSKDEDILIYEVFEEVAEGKKPDMNEWDSWYQPYYVVRIIGGKEKYRRRY